MILLAVGIALFTALHMTAVAPAVRARLRERFGAAAYGMGHGFLSIISLLMVVLGWRMSPFIEVYRPLAHGYLINYGMTLLAFLCLGIFLFRGSWRQALRFPMAYAVMLWGGGHLFANGDLASLILFGGFALAGLLMLVVGRANGVRPSPDVRGGHNGLSLLAGLALYALMTQLHEVLIGVPIFSLT